MTALAVLSLHARAVPADARSRFAERAEATLRPGIVMLTTCHRVEIYGTPDQLAMLRTGLPPGTVELEGDGAARHLVRLAVGLQSAVVAEDQVLHQLRSAAGRARARGRLPPALDHLLDAALRAGRRARTWLPRRGGLVELALSRLDEATDWSAPVLIVGAGEMGSRASRALAERQVSMAVTSRTPERAAVLAAQVGARRLAFDPGAAELSRLGGIIVALAGTWPLAPASGAALARSRAWVIDLSAPGALAASLRVALGRRLINIDDLAATEPPGLSRRLLDRLEALVESTLDQHRRWSEADLQRGLARALTERASAVREAELEALWSRLPGIAPEQRSEVEQMAYRLTDGILRDPLEQLDADGDPAAVAAARQLFRL